MQLKSDREQGLCPGWNEAVFRAGGSGGWFTQCYYIQLASASCFQSLLPCQPAGSEGVLKVPFDLAPLC